MSDRSFASITVVAIRRSNSLPLDPNLRDSQAILDPERGSRNGLMA